MNHFVNFYNRQVQATLSVPRMVDLFIQLIVHKNCPENPIARLVTEWHLNDAPFDDQTDFYNINLLFGAPL